MGALEKIVIMGGTGGGQISAKVIEDINRDKPTWEIVGYLNDELDINSRMLDDYRVVGRTAEAPDFVQKGVYLHYALHNNRYNKSRAKRLLDLELPLEAFPTLIHPTSHVSWATSIGQGVLVSPMVHFSVETSIDDFSYCGGAVFLGHHTQIKKFVTISNHASLGGSLLIGDYCHIGINCSIREHVTVGQSAIVGMGAVVLNDVRENEIAVGNPARIIGTVDRYTDPMAAKTV